MPASSSLQRVTAAASVAHSVAESLSSLEKLIHSATRKRLNLEQAEGSGSSYPLGKLPEDKFPLLLAVSKRQPLYKVRDAYSLGLRHFGENYVQELLKKAPLLPSDIKWHFIGKLQSNKCKALLDGCPNIHVVESVDSLKLANKLEAARQQHGGPINPLNILLQIKTSDEESKTGMENEPLAIKQLIQHVLTQCPSLRFCGFMTIGNPNISEVTENFESLVKLRDFVMSELPGLRDIFRERTFELSMGMTNDMELAIEKGSTEVRVGTAIFGPRGPKDEVFIVDESEEEKEVDENNERDAGGAVQA